MPKFIARERKQKKQAKHGAQGDTIKAYPADSNIVELLPVSTAEKEKTRQRLREELRAQQPKISAKKKKRLDKYIDNKLRKDENLELLKKLARAKVDTSLLQSSKRLTKQDSRRAGAPIALKERLAGRSVESDEESLHGEGSSSQSEADGRDDGNKSDSLGNFSNVVEDINSRQKPEELPATGSGLKHPLETDRDGNPIIARKRRKITTVHPSIFERGHIPAGFGSSDIPRYEESFSGFSSSDEDSDSEESISSGVEEEEAPSASLSDVNSEDESETSSSRSDQDAKVNGITSKQRLSAFTAWADQRRNEALGYQSTINAHVGDEPTTTKVQAPFIQPRKDDQDPMPEELKIGSSDRKAFSVHVERSVEVSSRRLALPVVAEEQRIMEAIHNNPVVVICGETGSGKTTQIPQFLFEAGYGNPGSQNPGMIGITQPRRVAAVSMAGRVASELGKDADRVAYKIRFEGSVKGKTTIKFMTDGILLREASEDIALRKYSAIIIDEAHERSKDTDILLGMMSRIVKLRESLSLEDPGIKPLKLVIMSATLTVADFTENRNLYFPAPPVVQVEGRQYPVTVHWARRTTRDYLDEAYNKISKGHRRLPPGGMLVFLPGQNEIAHLLRRLRQAFPSAGSGQGTTGLVVQLSGTEAPVEPEDLDIGPTQDRSDMSDQESDTSTGLTINVGEDEDDFRLDEAPEQDTPMHVLPLYSLLPTNEQLRVFDPPPEGSRLVILSTNIAETSLTIPGIRYVFDCGRAKERKYNEETGVQSFEVGWISKASASQRAGRAGRTGPGHCYRLYSSAVYERDFEERTQPEIQRTPLEGVVLQLVGLRVPNILEKFPFPTPPDPRRIDKAKSLLSNLGALSNPGQLTELGRKMSALPLMPRFSKMLLTGHGHACLPYTVALVAALSVPSLLLPENHLETSTEQRLNDEGFFGNYERLEEDAREARVKAYNQSQSTLSKLGGKSDVIKLLAAVVAHTQSSNPEAFCEKMFLRTKAMREIRLLRSQLSHLLRADPLYHSMLPPGEDALSTPSDKQIKYLKQVAASGFVDQVAIRADMAPQPPEQFRKPKRAIDVPFLSLFRTSFHRDEDRAIYIHPSSVLSRLSATDMPEYIIYSSLQKSGNSSKVRMHPLTPVSAKQLDILTRGTPLQSYGKPIKEVIRDTPEGIRRECWVVPSLRGNAGSQGWPLPARAIVQRKVNGVWVDC